jgi:peptidoglycan/xylan/chitin deacetylase (PgdA/CDA1 family)
LEVLSPSGPTSNNLCCLPEAFTGNETSGNSAVALVRILLTFDDGPDAGGLGGYNHTDKVLDALGRKSAIGVFFIQTHVSYRLPSPNGLTIASRAHAEGHVLAIHTGSLADHRCHKWRCTQPADMAGATNGLDSDMIRAKAAIKTITGTDPKFVRATYGYTDAHCMRAYSQNELKHVYWDLTSGDDRKNATVFSVRAFLSAESRRLATAGGDLICLLHDIARVTADHLPEFMDAIATAVRMNGHTPVFVADRLQAEVIMDSKSRPGTDTPCPPGSMGY